MKLNSSKSYQVLGIIVCASVILCYTLVLIYYPSSSLAELKDNMLQSMSAPTSNCANATTVTPRKQALLHNLNELTTNARQEAFDKIFSNKLWGASEESVSGAGSSKGKTIVIIKNIFSNIIVFDY